MQKAITNPEVYCVHYYRLVPPTIPWYPLALANGSFDVRVLDGKLQVLTLSAGKFNDLVDSSSWVGFHLDDPNDLSNESVVFFWKSDDNRLGDAVFRNFGTTKQQRKAKCEDEMGDAALQKFREFDQDFGRAMEQAGDRIMLLDETNVKKAQCFSTITQALTDHVVKGCQCHPRQQRRRR